MGTYVRRPLRSVRSAFCTVGQAWTAESLAGAMQLTLAQLEQVLPTISWQVALRNPHRESETESDLDSALGPRLDQVWQQATGLIETCDGTVVAVPLIRRFVGRAKGQPGCPIFTAGEVVEEAVRDAEMLGAVGSVRELARVLSRMDRMPEWRS